MSAETDAAITFAILGFALFIMLIVWQRRYFALVVMRLKNPQIGHHVKIWHKDGTYTEYVVPNVKTFDWKKKPWAKMFDNLPDWLEQTKIPSAPYARDRRTGFPSYEFNEDSKECIDPKERQPDLFMYQVEQNDLENAFELGRKWERMKDGSSFNRILLILLILNLGASVMSFVFINNLSTAVTEIKDNQITPAIANINQAILDVKEGRIIVRTHANPPTSLPPGQSGQVG